MPGKLKYEPLHTDLDEVRVLEVKPAKTTNKPLRGIIRHEPLSTARYNALSYTWSQNDGSIIRIRYPRSLGRLLRGHWSRGAKLEISSNLAQALKCLRDTEESIYIWIDQICINQRDREEKGHQIALMRKIYSRARIVHAWLGPDVNVPKQTRDNISVAFNLAGVIWSRAQSVGVNERPLQERDWLQTCLVVASMRTYAAQNSSKYRQQDQEDDFDSSKWTEYSHALRLAISSDAALMEQMVVFCDLSLVKWFSRIWILQEFGRASDLTFHYGSLSCPRLQLFLGLSLATSFRTTAAGSGVESLDKRFLACVTARTTCTEAVSVNEVLKAGINSLPPTHRATVPPDLIHARLGLANDESEYPKEITQVYRNGSINNDTEDLSTARVFASVARHLLSDGVMDSLIIFKPYDWMQSSGLGQFAAKAAGKPTGWSMPSWVYDWSKDGQHTFAGYHASKGSEPSASFVKYPIPIFGEALTMTGLGVGTINDCSRRFSRHVFDAKLITNEIKGAIRDADLHTDVVTLSASQASEVRRKIQDANQILDLHPSQVILDKFFDTPQGFPAAGFWCWWLSWVSELIRLGACDQFDNVRNIAELLFRDASARLQPQMSIIGEVFGGTDNLATLMDLRRWCVLLCSEDERMRMVGRELAETFFRSAWGMRVAILDSGRLCYVPEDSEMGNEVVLFHGVRAPLVLRRSDDAVAQHIVGPTHVSGIMQGQLMDGRLPARKYILV